MDDYGYEKPLRRVRDVAVDSAIKVLEAFFEKSPHELFYSTQIETRLEREFFHWITGRALLELADAGRIQRAPTAVQGNTINFYAHSKHRYWRREQKEMVRLLKRIFNPEFAQAVGRHGELMFDAALGRHGFRVEARNTSSWKGKGWTETNHNLDRIVTRDGHEYGVEIKNTQNYIPRRELQTKIRLCAHLGLTPLFIMRFAPKSYIFEVNQHGGFVLLFENQIYPMGHTALVAEVRARLGLKVHSPNDIMDGDMQRLMKWHHKRPTHASQ